MVALYVKGQKVGTWADSEQLVSQLAKDPREVELRDETGKLIARIVPAAEPLCPWDPTLTKEEIDRRIAEGGGMTLKEFWKKMGVE